MKILIYVGNHFKNLNLSDISSLAENGIFGQTMGIATTFAREGHSVSICGDCETTTASGVSFQNISEVPHGEHYDLVIGVQRIEYIRVLERAGVTWDKSIFVVHYEFHSYMFDGDPLPDDGNAEFFDPRMTWVVLQSEEHLKRFTKYHPAAWMKAKVLENAIDVEKWLDGETQKVPGRFIFTTADKNGLDRLFAIWPKIRDINPAATLHIASPLDSNIQDHFSDLDGVTILGHLTPDELRSEIQSAEYWLDMTKFEHQGHLAALEMMASKVKIVSTGQGAVSKIVESFGIPLKSKSVDDLENEALRVLTECFHNASKLEHGLSDGEEYARKQSWNARYADWISLIDQPAEQIDTALPLYSHDTERANWDKSFITGPARSQSWELIADEPVDCCFTFPLFTKEFCLSLRELADRFDTWPIDGFQTTRLNLVSLGLKEALDSVITDYILPASCALYGTTWGSGKTRNEFFITKYDSAANSGAVSQHAMHHDGNDLSCVIQLSDLSEYKGGGTFFSRQKALVKNDMGVATMFPGNFTHRHGAREVEDGTRYILAVFITKP